MTPESRVAPKKACLNALNKACCPLTSKATDPLMQFQYADGTQYTAYRTLGFALIPVITVTQTRKNRDLYSTNITNHLSVHISDFLSIFKDTFITACGSKRSGSWHFGPVEKTVTLTVSLNTAQRAGWLWAGVNGVLLGKWCWGMKFRGGMRVDKKCRQNTLCVNSTLWWEILMPQCLKTVI